MRRIGTIPIVAGIILTTIAIAASLVAFGDVRLFGNSESVKVFGRTKPNAIVNVVSSPFSPVAVRPSSLSSGVPLANGGQYATTYPVVNYGAKCDGTTDDSTAFAKAFAAIPSTGGTLRLPAGTCIVNSTLHVVSNTAVVGAGKKLSVLKTDYASMPQIIVADGASNVRLSDFLLTRSVIATSGGDGIDTSLNSNTTNIVINWIAVEKAYVGFKLGPAIDVSTLQNCIADNDESDGFLFTFATRAPSSIVLNWFVSHDISQFNGGIGFHYLAAADDNISLVTMQTLNNLLTDQNAGGGLWVNGNSTTGFDYTEVSASTFGLDGNDEVHLDNYVTAAQKTLTGVSTEYAGTASTGPNTVKSASNIGSGIKILSGPVAISGGRDVGNSANGIDVEGSSAVLISGRIESANKANGILDNATAGVSVTGALLSGNTGYGISYTSSGGLYMAGDMCGANTAGNKSGTPTQNVGGNC